MKIEKIFNNVGNESHKLDLNENKIQIILGRGGLGYVECVMDNIKNENIIVYNTLTDYQPLTKEEVDEICKEVNIEQENYSYIDVNDMLLQHVCCIYKFILNNKNKHMFIVLPETGMDIALQQDFIDILIKYDIKAWVFTMSPFIMGSHQELFKAWKWKE